MRRAPADRWFQLGANGRVRVPGCGRWAVTVVAVAVGAGGLAGCAGIPNPYQARTSTTRAAAPSPAPTPPSDSGDPAPERAGTAPSSSLRTLRRLDAGAGQPTPRVALSRYASLYINWRAATVARTQRQLAAISLGQARAQALQAAASLSDDRELTASDVANSGAVVAITAGEGPAAGSWVVVTRERTTGRGDYAGLPPTLHVIYAQLTDTREGWLVTGWRPQE